MPISTNYLFIASMDVDPDKDAVFNDVYDNDHIPHLLKVPGLLSAARFQLDELTMLIGGEKRTIRIENEPKYTGVYELESPEVLLTEAWGNAVEAGRWPKEVRPFTKNRRHVLMKRIQST